MASVLNIHFFAAVTQQTVQDLINLVGAATNQLQAQGEPATDLVLRISSPGGSSDHGLLAYNFLRQIPIANKFAIGMGNVDSAAILPFLACDHRYSLPNCRYLIHESKASGQYVDMTYSKLKEQLSIVKSINDAYAGVIAGRTSRSPRTCKQWMAKSGVMSAEKAQERGFLEQIVVEDFLPIQITPTTRTFTVTITDPALTQVPPQAAGLSY